jgi:hypothetical protein
MAGTRRFDAKMHSSFQGINHIPDLEDRIRTCDPQSAGSYQARFVTVAIFVPCEHSRLHFTPYLP